MHIKHLQFLMCNTVGHTNMWTLVNFNNIITVFRLTTEFLSSCIELNSILQYRPNITIPADEDWWNSIKWQRVLKNFEGGVILDFVDTSFRPLIWENGFFTDVSRLPFMLLSNGWETAAISQISKRRQITSYMSYQHYSQTKNVFNIKVLTILPALVQFGRMVKKWLPSCILLLHIVCSEIIVFYTDILTTFQCIVVNIGQMVEKWQ